MAENIKWTDELGNAFLAQQNDVMEAVQRMRAKAKNGGKLQSNEQMKVETKVMESKNVIVIEQAKPEVVYVPSYDPVVVWGAAPVYVIRRSSIQRDITPQGWRFHLESDWPWGPCGAEAGVMVPDGEATTTSTSTTTTTSTAITLETETGAEPATVTGSTILSTAEEPPMEIEAQRISLAVACVGIRLLRDSRARGRIRVSGLEGSLGLATARAVELAM